MDVHERLTALGIVLPAPRIPSASYVHARQAGSLVFLAGHSPKKDGAYPALGKVGAEVSMEMAQECARNCAINLLGSLFKHCGTLNSVLAIIQLTGYVASAPHFTDQPLVINAASDLLHDIFGDVGKHARTAVGVSVLPGDIPVEIDMIVEVSN